MRLPGNPNRVDVERYARAAGVRVERVDGEVVYSHPSWPHAVRVSSGRKDSPRKLLTLLRRTPVPESR